MRGLAKLVRDRTARRDEQRLVIDGPRALSTFLDAGGVVEAVFADAAERVPSTLPDDVAVYLVERRELDRIADSSTPQGLLAVGRFVPVSLDRVATNATKIVVLDGVQDPGNVGAVVRVAAAAGVDALIAAKGTADVSSPRAVRASAGTIAMLDVVVGVSAAEAVEVLQTAGVTTVATAMDGEPMSTPISADRVAWVFGAEGPGVSAEVLAAVDHRVAVPMAAPVESLNVAVTAGIVLYAAAQPGPTA